MNDILSLWVIFPFSFCPWNGSECIHFSPANTHTPKSILLKSAVLPANFFFIFTATRTSAYKTNERPTLAVTYFIFVSESLTVVRNIHESHHSKNDYFLVIFRCIELKVKETDNHETKEITQRIKTLLDSWNSYWCQQRWVRIMIAILL